MGIFILIGIEILFVAALIIGWLRYDDKIRAFEDRRIKQFKKLFKRVKRNLCARWLAEDGMTAVPRIANNEDIINSGAVRSLRG